MSEKVKDWDNMSNSSIKKELEGLLHRQISLNDKIIKL